MTSSTRAPVGTCRGCAASPRRLTSAGFCRTCLECGTPAPIRGPIALPPAPEKLVGRWPMDALTNPAARMRLERAGADLASVRAELEVDRQRASRAAALREQERALRAEGQSIAYDLAVDRPDDLELASHAPTVYRNLRRGRPEE